MRKFIAFLLMLFPLCVDTPAFGDDTEKITVEFDLSLPEKKYTSGSSIDLYLYDKDGECTHDGTDEKQKSFRIVSTRSSGSLIEDKAKFICPKDKNSLTLVFDFNKGKGTDVPGLGAPGDATPANYVKTLDISEKKKHEIKETIETLYQKKFRKIKEIGSKYCKNGSYAFNSYTFCCDAGYKDSNTTKLRAELKEVAGEGFGIRLKTDCSKAKATTEQQKNPPKSVTVTGTVECVFEDGGDPEACVGASVQEYVDGKPGNGMAVGIDGKFELTVTPGNELEFSFVGKKDKRIKVDADKTDLGIINIEDGSNDLDEVVVVGKTCKEPNEKEVAYGIKKMRLIDDECYPAECIEPRWKLKGEGKKAKCEEQKCKFDNGTGEWVKNNDVWACKLKECKNGYQGENKADGSGEYCREMLKKCTDEQAKKHPNATKTGIKKGTETCIAQECKCGFELKDEKCVAWPENKECTADTKPRLPDDAASAKMVCENDKAVCKIDKCVSDDYELKDNKCESKKKQSCTAEDKNATAAEYKKRDGKLVCVITACKKNYSVDKDNNKCVAGMVLSDEDQKARVAELEENAKKMKDKEQSMENKLLGAAGMGLTGTGLMQSMSAGAEQKADEEAELDMNAYLATMHCNYAPGKNVKGGEKAVELPGANSLMPLYTEYVALANDLKVRKAALGMQPGIESEAILDGATSGLYDDVALGKTGGAYTSLARALSDPNGEDAKKWAAQKEEAAKDKKTGTTLAAVGAIGSAVANIAINKNAPKESSDEIESKYDKKRVSADTLEKGDIDGTDGSNDGSKGIVGGTVPQSDKIADKECSPACNADTQNCVDGVCVEKVKTCTGDQELVGGECKPKCGADETRDDNSECVKKLDDVDNTNVLTDDQSTQIVEITENVPDVVGVNSASAKRIDDINVENVVEKLKLLGLLNLHEKQSMVLKWYAEKCYEYGDVSMYAYADVDSSVRLVCLFNDLETTQADVNELFAMPQIKKCLSEYGDFEYYSCDEIAGYKNTSYYKKIQKLDERGIQLLANYSDSGRKEEMCSGESCMKIPKQHGKELIIYDGSLLRILLIKYCKNSNGEHDTNSITVYSDGRVEEEKCKGELMSNIPEWL